MFPNIWQSPYPFPPHPSIFPRAAVAILVPIKFAVGVSHRTVDLNIHVVAVDIRYGEKTKPDLSGLC